MTANYILRHGRAAIAGLIFGLLLTATFGYTSFVKAEADYCLDSTGCEGAYCFTSLTGVKSCKYWGNPSGCPTECRTVDVPD